ncbi:pyridoxamine 5'-phosphate oxidase [Ornithobacterium rhinotracheale]|uniref:Pyridoxine/pyridoxamine 5'-phosphate oxidase n=1 Tax=Ornithobacterium rhinotracheale TaxID=28251 RepID=A0A3R5Y363_ORNRH|nr:pyridoxamine 5'-phosphate oxidase [Ornithobacterium rhinotracheale]QAR30634.1 pyridoxamine 5'-phosphate oxidase [Ornithobacterium rhinotracheale]
MEQDLSNYRKSYEKFQLIESEVSANPMELFRDWFYVADNEAKISEANAMSVATIGLDGYPKTRVVLLKKFTHEGFIFYTNYDSEKGQAIAADDKVCLSFFWPVLERQIIIKGVAEKLPENLSDGYFESRPKQSQISAIVSPQSSVVPSRDFLENKVKEVERDSQSADFQRPKNWGGYLVRPVSIEFWQGRANRLHDRLRYTLQEDYDWKIERLAP